MRFLFEHRGGDARDVSLLKAAYRYNGDQKQFQNYLGERDSPIFPRGLGKIGTVPGRF